MSKSTFNLDVIRVLCDGYKVLELNTRHDLANVPYSVIKSHRQTYFALDYTLLDFEPTATYNDNPIVEIMAQGTVSLKTFNTRFLLIIITRNETC